MGELPLFPEVASTTAVDVDHLYFYLTAVSVIMTGLIFLAVFVFALKYRRRNENEVGAPIHGSLRIEVAWSIIPFLIMLTFFWWGSSIYFDNATAPSNASDVYIVGKQWMWKVQYPEGQREINELHVPVGQPVKITLASEDVIHSFFIPAFRVKHDVVPGHYDTMWFTAGWLNQLIDEDLELFRGLKTILAGGDKLSPDHINRLLRHYPGLKVINGYGPTENTTFSLTYRISPGLENIPIGKPIDNSTVYILGPQQQLSPGPAGKQ